MLEPALSAEIGSGFHRRSHPRFSPVLPEKPLVSGGPGKSQGGLSLSVLWTYRELLYFLTWRDIKVRYKQTVMGAAWAIIQPLVTMLVLTVFFNIFAGVPSDHIPYPVFVFAGLVPWVFFSNAVANCSTSLVGSSGLISKVYFPRVIVPAATVSAGVVDVAIASLILVALTNLYGIPMTWNLALLPVLLMLTLMLSLAFGILVSALTVKYRDIRHALPFVLQTWMFASPIIYPQSVVQAKWRWLLALNPLTGIIEGFRSSLVGLEFNWPLLAAAFFETCVVLTVSAYSFRRLEKSFADLV